MASLKANNVLIETLGTSLRYGGSALSDVPELLKRILIEESWREFETRRGEHVTHERFGSFVEAAPLRGLGADMALIRRIAGTDDPELTNLLTDAQRIGHGPGRGHKSRGESPQLLNADTTARDTARLAREAPGEFGAVERGEKSINAAAISAGIRRRRVPVRLDSAESAARTLRKHMPREALVRLAELLTEDQGD